MKYLKFWKTVVCFIVITVISLTPGDEFKEISFIKIKDFDKISHFMMYFTFGFLVIQDSPKVFSKVKFYSMTLVFPVLTGLLLEIIQYYFIPFRDGNSIDFLANCAGVIVAFTVFAKYKPTNVVN